MSDKEIHASNSLHQIIDPLIDPWSDRGRQTRVVFAKTKRPNHGPSHLLASSAVGSVLDSTGRLAFLAIDPAGPQLCKPIFGDPEATLVKIS